MAAFGRASEYDSDYPPEIPTPPPSRPLGTTEAGDPSKQKTKTANPSPCERCCISACHFIDGHSQAMANLMALYLRCPDDRFDSQLGLRSSHARRTGKASLCG